ncbi:MAG: CPBP family intramembrane metalloprotease [Actinobacteria bacterium]|nr:CPBP family intramembrane metalloprotease [Actinomycetota bacterium]
MTQAPWPPPSVEYEPKRSLLSILLLWVGCYLAAVMLSVAVMSITGSTSTSGASSDAATDSPTTWVFALSLLGLWLPFVFMLRWVARRAGTDFRQCFGMRFATTDWLGIPLGIFCQVVLMNVVNWPLNKWFPDTFNPQRIETRARDIVDAAQGAWFIVLFVVVVVGAPLVEELVYRGFIQGGLQARIGSTWALIITAAWFTVVHNKPIEFPGLFAFALVLGFCYRRTQRVGLSMVTHLAFNATGLLLVALS